MSIKCGCVLVIEFLILILVGCEKNWYFPSGQHRIRKSLVYENKWNCLRKAQLSAMHMELYYLLTYLLHGAESFLRS